MIYTGDQLKELIFPLGGIGSGSIGLAGNGCLVDWEIFNRPSKGSLNHYSFFVVKAEYPDGTSVIKVLQGDWTKDLIGKYTKEKLEGYGFGPSSGTMCAFPHFKNIEFDGSFPIAKVRFSDDLFPATVIMTAFNPFIPLNADDSSIPGAFFEIAFADTDPTVRYSAIFSVRNPFPCSINENVSDDDNTAVCLRHAGVDNDSAEYGDLTVAINRTHGIIQQYWYRGRWRDGVTTFWGELEKGQIDNRIYDNPGVNDNCSVGAVLNPGEANHSLRFVLTWNVPHNYNYWKPWRDEDGKDILWKNYYAVLFSDSHASALYSLQNWDKLFAATDDFRLSLHTSTLDPVVIDAVSSTLSVLKSATVLRLEDGTFYGWEGVRELEGACEGTNTHVWSYVYSLCFLFPELERSIRDAEFRYDTDEDGKMQYRTQIPLGRPRNNRFPCVDGQMATVMKIYRDWKITGNTEWLRNNWENVKKILEYAWNKNNIYEWDVDHDGVLEGMQHHTLDMEIFGPSSWLEGMYLGALKAASEMARFLGDNEKEKEYISLFNKGFMWTKENLFNGEYFFHKVDIERKEYTDHFNCPEYWNDEKKQLKYQIADGCEIDQMLGQWHANICGLGDIFDPAQRKLALRHMFQNNYKASMRDFANAWRVFALNDEQGTVICDYPNDKNKPWIPIPYCEECMTGFEYAFAGLLMSEGFISEGLKVVHAIRDRYDGKKRNPFNEIEYGSNYARSMSSFALLPILSGFEYDLPHEHIGFAPLAAGDFKCFWSVGTGWGNYIHTTACTSVEVHSGELVLSSFRLGNTAMVLSVKIDGREIPYTQTNDIIRFEKATIKEELYVETVAI